MTDTVPVWQPIETAPHNERVLIQANNESTDEIAMGWWDIGDNRWYYAPQGGLVQWTPTHWQPIPEQRISWNDTRRIAQRDRAICSSLLRAAGIRGQNDCRAMEADMKVTAEDLKRATWKAKGFGSGPSMHVRDYTCVEYPRVMLRELDEKTAAGWTHKQTMFVDGKEVGGSAEAAAALNLGQEAG